MSTIERKSVLAVRSQVKLDPRTTDLAKRHQKMLVYVFERFCNGHCPYRMKRNSVISAVPFICKFQAGG